jgi:hypothetical protein
MRALILMLAAAVAPMLTYAQPAEVYKVELTMHDATDASAKAGRKYVILIDTHGAGTFKIGSREPVASGSFQPGTGGVGINPLVNTQFTYVDTGVNIDCKLDTADASRLQLRADIDISSIVPHEKSVIPNPVIGQLKLAVMALIVPGKRTVIASIDDPVSNRKFDIEALITKGE